MILRFRHKGLEKFFSSGNTRGINAQHSRRIKLLLGILATAQSPVEMNIAGARLHPLKGELAGYWAVSVSGNWRLVFRFKGNDATDVDLIDYH
ncbi:MAG: type II toxin-antitoxin system RelE/ParE family toxin [Alphaproteobacteria bacterium]|nr:type II toxin-antitoxin system RelE/ParE family toxin [Alphaproteobacteria bacterium]